MFAHNKLFDIFRILYSIFKQIPFFNFLIVRIRNKIFLFNNVRLHRRKLMKEILLFNSSDPDITPVLLYQMGKVGSSSIEKILKSSKLGIPVLSAHHFNYDSLHSVKAYVKLSFPKEVYSEFERNFFGFYKDRIVYDIVKNLLKNGRLKIISVVRDPVARNISSYFQSIDRRFLDLNNRFENKSLTIEEIISTFFKYEKHELPIKWFDQEIKDIFGIDLYLNQFSKAKGYHIYKYDNIDFMVLKLEMLSECAQFAFKEFLNLSGVQILYNNVTANKPYGHLYHQFINSIHLSDSYLDQMYNSKFMRFFYSEAEINLFRKRWNTN